MSNLWKLPQPLGNRALWLSHCAGLWSAPFLGLVGFVD